MLNVVIFCWIKPFGDFLSILVVPSIHEHLIILHVLIKHNKYICIHAPSFPKKKKKLISLSEHKILKMKEFQLKHLKFLEF